MVSSGEIDSWRRDIKRQFDQYLDQPAKMPDDLVRVLRSSRDPRKEIATVAEEMVGGSSGDFDAWPLGVRTTLPRK